MLAQLQEGRGCECCKRLQGDLASSLRVLSEKGMGRYGDLLREKFSLQEKVRVQLEQCLCSRDSVLREINR